jgi:hypothetical protein
LAFDVIAKSISQTSQWKLIVLYLYIFLYLIKNFYLWCTVKVAQAYPFNAKATAKPAMHANLFKDISMDGRPSIPLDQKQDTVIYSVYTWLV